MLIEVTRMSSLTKYIMVICKVKHAGKLIPQDYVQHLLTAIYIKKRDTFCLLVILNHQPKREKNLYVHRII